MTTGIVVPMSFAVWALNALTNSMMLMPCWPRAGPTGGAGEAWPPGACSLMVVRTFLAMIAFPLRAHSYALGIRFRLPGEPASPPLGTGFRLPGERAPSFAARLRRRYVLDFLHLIVADLDGRLPPEDRDQDLQPRRVLVDLGDLTREVRERAGDDLDRLADGELRTRGGAHRDLAMQQPVDLRLRERDRLVGRADEAGDARRPLHDLPGVLVEVHVHEDVARHRALLHGDLLVVLHLLDGLGRDDDLAHGTGLVERRDAMLEVLLDLLLVAGVGVDDVPAEHGDSELLVLRGWLR